MAHCTASYIVVSIQDPGLITARVRFDIIDTPVGCVLAGSDPTLLRRFSTDVTKIKINTTTFFPADGLHGGPPNVSYFSGTRIEVPEAFIMVLPAAAEVTWQTADFVSTIVLEFTLPTADDQSLVMCELDGSIAVTLTGTLGSGPGPLTYSIVAGPSHGSLGSLVGTAVTYTPTPGYTGSDSFTFKTNDGANDSLVGTITISVNPAFWWCLPNGTRIEACSAPACVMYPYDIRVGNTTYPAGTCLPYTLCVAPDASYCQATDGSWYHGACPIIPQQWRLEQFTIKPRNESTS